MNDVLLRSVFSPGAVCQGRRVTVEALRAMMLVRVLRLPNVVILVLYLVVLRTVMVLILGPDVMIASICWARTTGLFRPWVIVIVMKAALTVMKVVILWLLLFFLEKIEKAGVGSCS